MSLINPVYFEKENIIRNKFDASEALAEQAVHCLALVAQLVDAGLSFQFKGGNSLLLVLDKPLRFSIDVDIATNESRERIEACLDDIVHRHGLFLKWTRRQHKTKPWLPLASYFCFYRSHFVNENDAFVMLDAQLTRSPYATTFTAVRCGRLFASDSKVEIPLASSIIGDKLLTLGPETLGIPFGKGKDAQRLKHVFDVSLLLRTEAPLNEIKKSFFACLEHENKLQEKAIPVVCVLADTLAYCESIRSMAYCGEPNDTMTVAQRENTVGFAPFAGHLFSKNYTWDTLALDLARVAFVMASVCTSKIEDGRFTDVLRQCGDNARSYWQAIKELV